MLQRQLARANEAKGNIFTPEVAFRTSHKYAGKVRRPCKDNCYQRADKGGRLLIRNGCFVRQLETADRNAMARNGEHYCTRCFFGTCPIDGCHNPIEDGTYGVCTKHRPHGFVSTTAEKKSQTERKKRAHLDGDRQGMEKKKSKSE